MKQAGGEVAAQTTNKPSLISDPQVAFDLGKLYADRGDFQAAIDKLTAVAFTSFDKKNHELYLKAQNLLLRIYAEQKNIIALEKVTDQIFLHVAEKTIALTAKSYFTLALCASYRGNQKEAFNFLQKSMQLAIVQEDQESICYCYGGIAAIHVLNDSLDEALHAIDKLEVLLLKYNFPELKISALSNKAIVYATRENYDLALSFLWQAYDEVRGQKSVIQYVNLLYTIGWTYAKSDNAHLARIYLTLAQRSCDPENLTYRSQLIQTELDKISELTAQRFDLVIDLENHLVTEKTMGEIDFKNQFILLEMFKLFVNQPGKPVSKEALTQHIWQEVYSPTVHDNKIYVSIKRLRKLIEPDIKKSKYIVRGKDGYFLNANTTVSYEVRRSHENGN